LEEKYEDKYGVIRRHINRRTTDNTMTKKKTTKGQTTIWKTLYIKLKMVLQLNRSITHNHSKDLKTKIPCRILLFFLMN